MPQGATGARLDLVTHAGITTAAQLPFNALLLYPRRGSPRALGGPCASYVCSLWVPSGLPATLRAVSQLVAQAREQTSGDPLLTVAARRVGLRRAFKVLSFMAAWDHAQRAVGHELGITEYARWWNEPEATAYRHQALFRNAFPDETTPARLLTLASTQWDQRLGLRALGNVCIT